MGRDEIVSLRGLHTNPNQFLVPDGGMRLATNVWMTKPGIIQQRRGFTRWSQTLTFAINKIFPYAGELIVHAGSDRMNRVSTGGVVTSLGSGFNAPTTDWRVRGCISGKNFYFNSSAEVWRLSGSDAIVKSGGLVAPGFDNMGVATPLTDAGTGFLGDGYSVAYRYELVRFDSFGREIVGPVSGRLIVANVSGVTGYSAGDASNYTVRALLPSDATQYDVIRIYRSAQKLSGQALDDDLKLVYEKQLKQLDITNGYFEQKDITPDVARGDFIYTSPNAAEGIAQNNELPPNCMDLAEHKSRVWYANTTRRSEFQLQILAVGGTNGIANNDTLIINGMTFTAKTAAPGTGEYLTVTGGTAAYNIEQTALNLVSCINKTASNTTVWARYVSAPNDYPGKILLSSRSPVSAGYSVAVGGSSNRDCWNPGLPSTNATYDLSRTANVVTATKVSGNTKLKVGEQVLINPFVGPTGTFGVGPFTITAVTATTFTYSETGINATLAAQDVFLNATDVAQFFQEVLVNRVYYSKFAEGDAVPRDNWLDVGAADQPIIAIVSQGETLQVWKRDGIFRIVGTDELSFEALEVDTTVRAVAREMIVKFQGKVAGLTDKGFVMVSETGVVSPFDLPVREDILAQITTLGDDLEKYCFCVGYEAEDLLLCFFSGNKDLVTDTGTLCNTGYVFNGQANEWTLWQWDTNNGNGNGKRCGLMNPVDRSLYFGDSYLTSASSCWLYKERKSRAASDYSDQRGASAVTNFSIPSIISPVIQTGRAAGLVKEWAEVALLFDKGGQPASLSVVDANEWGQGGTHTLVPSGGYTVRFWPHAAVARGALLIVTITHDTVSEDFRLAGLAVTYKVDGVQVNR